MDMCQPIYISIENEMNKRYFLLIIKDEDLVKKGDPEPFYYVLNWDTKAVNLNYFKTAEEAYTHAMKLFPADKVIVEIKSLSMNNFLTDKELVTLKNK